MKAGGMHAARNDVARKIAKLLVSASLVFVPVRPPRDTHLRIAWSYKRGERIIRRRRRRRRRVSS